MNELDAALLAAHANDDKVALVDLYRQAANSADEPQAVSFYLTHAYIFALETAHPSAAELRARLVDMGCEDPD